MQLVKESAEFVSVFSSINVLRVRAQNRKTASGKGWSKRIWNLTTHGDNNAARFRERCDIPDAFFRELIKKEKITFIIIRAHRFGIAVDHCDSETLSLQFMDSLNAAPIKLDG